MEKTQIKAEIQAGTTALGIEFGSTNIKAVLVASDYSVIATGSHGWENQLENGIWTYSLDAIWSGLQDAYSNLSGQIKDQYGLTLTKIGSLGIAAMMHGYMPFKADGELLVPFRTWRNALTEEAALQLTHLFNFNIPERWSIAHLYQAVLNQESHVKDIDYITTLSGYVHWMLSGEKVLGIGDASGMFPIDSLSHDYDQDMLDKFNGLKSVQQYHWTLPEILPTIKLAGETAGQLTAAGAKLLDVSGNLQAGAVMAPPEGDAGTGMVATNSVKQRTGNVSAGTSVFAMIVLEKALSKLHTSIDMVTTPDGSAVAMVHANNSSSDINAWAALFNEFANKIGVTLSPNELYGTLFNSVLQADPDTSGLLAYGYYSGENITGMSEGRPVLARMPNSEFTIGNLMRTNLYSAFGALKIGLDILKAENVATDSIVAQGGIFKTPLVGQKMLAAAMESPVTVMKTASEGGPWGMAILAEFAASESGLTLADFLEQKVFMDQERSTVAPDARDVAGFNNFMVRYKAGLPIEAHAVATLKY
ncbi:FGGY-family carbohydrate kinase [Weissella diestrammenae]|uniref:FGGY-family carbohydrate kinase n=1 Tax=Weissella diestrammenae TaxID=1162633 RepID=A0A7G9T480_9LACO|nr:FGGY-family carbohydrate kinase [Weissella diestrammenae]MCM0583431.1 FGGY-family carbohydrate kinase [Weissella diestrammenae]QNN74905.1 FGGY-family carbohydrate kinase [Weissella diestrammenae]